MVSEMGETKQHYLKRKVEKRRGSPQQGESREDMGNEAPPMAQPMGEQGQQRNINEGASGKARATIDGRVMIGG